MLKLCSQVEDHKGWLEWRFQVDCIFGSGLMVLGPKIWVPILVFRFSRVWVVGENGRIFHKLPLSQGFFAFFFTWKKYAETQKGSQICSTNFFPIPPACARIFPLENHDIHKFVFWETMISHYILHFNRYHSSLSNFNFSSNTKDANTFRGGSRKFIRYTGPRH